MQSCPWDFVCLWKPMWSKDVLFQISCCPTCVHYWEQDSGWKAHLVPSVIFLTPGNFCIGTVRNSEAGMITFIKTPFLPFHCRGISLLHQRPLGSIFLPPSINQSICAISLSSSYTIAFTESIGIMDSPRIEQANISVIGSPHFLKMAWLTHKPLKVSSVEGNGLWPLNCIAFWEHVF